MSKWRYLFHFSLYNGQLFYVYTETVEFFIKMSSYLVNSEISVLLLLTDRVLWLYRFFLLIIMLKIVIMILDD